MRQRSILRAAPPALFTLLLAACSAGGAPEEKPRKAPEAHAADGIVRLSAQQIAAAGIEIAHPSRGEGGGTIERPATIDADAQAMQIVSASIGGRIVALNRNLGQTVARGEMLAVIESREAASLKADVEAAIAREGLAQSILRREQRLFAEKVSPEQDLIAARTAATEASIASRLARQRLAATGRGGGDFNRVGIVAPIAGQVIGRSATLGQTVVADAELFRVARLDRVSVLLSLSPADAAHVRPGAVVTVTAAGRKGIGKVRFLSPALDPETRLVPAIALIDNGAGSWRVGEAVTAAVELAGAGKGTIRIPLTAIQTVAGKTVVFVRTATGFRVNAVAVGPQAGETVVILSGLDGSERLAAANSFILKSELGKADAGHED